MLWWIRALSYGEFASLHFDSPPVSGHAVLAIKMQMALAEGVRSQELLPVNVSQWTKIHEIFVNRDVEAFTIGSVFLHNQLNAVPSEKEIAEMLSVETDSKSSNNLKPTLATLRQPSGTGKSMLAKNVPFVLQRDRDPGVEERVAAKLGVPFQPGEGNAVVQALKRWTGHTLSGAPAPAPLEQNSSVASEDVAVVPVAEVSTAPASLTTSTKAAELDVSPNLLVSGLVDALANAVTLHLSCTNAGISTNTRPDDPVSQTLVNTIAEVLRVPLAIDWEQHTSSNDVLVLLCQRLADWCMRQTPRRALILVVDEYLNLVTKNRPVSEERYDALMTCLSRLVLIRGLCPILVGADTIRFFDALRSVGSPFPKQEIFLGALSLADIEEALRLGCELGILRNVKLIIDAFAKTTPSEARTSPYTMLATRIMLTTVGHARSVGYYIDLLNRSPVARPGVDPADIIFQTTNLAVTGITSGDNMLTFPLSIPASLMSNVIKSKNGDVSKLAEATIELLDAHLWRMNIRDRRMLSVPCNMDEFCYACGIPFVVDGQNLVLNFGAPLLRSMWDLVLKHSSLVYAKQFASLSTNIASLTALLPSWIAWHASWHNREGTGMGDPWENLLATALGVQINRAIRESASTQVNLLSVLPFIKNAVEAALKDKFSMAQFDMNLIQPVRAERIPVRVENRTSSATVNWMKVNAGLPATCSRTDLLALLQQRQGDVILPGRLSAAQDINVGASSAVLSVIAKSYQVAEFTWPS
ncbi:MAG: hypothetical protein EOO65_01425, partial [Methanosarcinales archaeon]